MSFWSTTKRLFSHMPSAPLGRGAPGASIHETHGDHPADLLHIFKLTDARGEHVGLLPWTVADAFEGTHVFGETGSGKTSGSGATLAAALLRRGFGGLVLTAKPDDVYDWIDPDTGFLKQAGFDRSKVHIFGEPVAADDHNPRSKGEPGSQYQIDIDHHFNFLDYEFQSGGKSTVNLVQLLLTALESGSHGNTGHDDAYWIDALRQLLTNAIDLCYLATRRVDLQTIQEIVQTAPQSREEARSAAWQKSSVCWRLLEQARDRIEKEREASETASAETQQTSSFDERNYGQTVVYWMLDFAGLSQRTRSVVVSTLTSKINPLTRSPMYELLCSEGQENQRPLDIPRLTRDGHVVIVNLPVKRYNEVGRFCQVLLKTVWQRHIERWPDKERPVFLWADEAQYFITRETAAAFSQST